MRVNGRRWWLGYGWRCNIRQGDEVLGLGFPVGTVHSRLTLFTTVTEVGEAVRVRIYGGLGFGSDTMLFERI